MSSQQVNFTTGDGRILNIKEIADIYRDGVNFAVPNSGRIQKLDANNYSLTCRFSTTDCDNLESIKTSKAYSLQTITRDNKERCIESVRCITEHQAVDELVVTSNNGRYLARLKGASQKGSNGDQSDKRQLLEIWDRSKLLKTIDLTEIDAHGLINTDRTFGSMSWYPFGDQDKLVYVCQKKSPKFQSFFKQTVVLDNESNGNSKGKQFNLGNEYKREEDWGEALNGIEHTLVAVLDVADNFKVTIMDENGMSLASTRWLNGMKTISVAYPEEPRRIGLVYCNSRKSNLVIHDWSQSKPVEVFTMTSNTHCYHTPRVDHSGQRFIYLSSQFWGPHKRSVRIHIHDLNTNQDIELTDKTTNESDLFVDNLLDDCFSDDDKYIILVKRDVLSDQMCLYSLAESKFTKIKFPTTGLGLLDFKHDVILATGSEVNATPTLFVAVLNPVDTGELVAWHQIEDCIHLEEIEYEPYKIAVPDGSSFVSALLVSPCIDHIQKSFVGEFKITSRLINNQTDLPTIIWVHGGPHSNFFMGYMPSLDFHARLGLRSLLINYRGSTGVSEDYSMSLCGKIGQLDVADCMHAIRYFTKNKLINPKKLIVQGGSHGGFLACHLSCQDEFKFTSAIIRNPVVDVSTMHTTTDTPDWCYAEALGQESFDFDWQPSSEEIAKMFECSPMSRFRQANVPTLMLLGTKDRRVPMFQGERWFELLKARGIKTECKVYADKHALDRPEVSADSTLSAIIWILSNL